MSRLQLTSCFLFSILICHPGSLFAQEPPLSDHQLLQRFEASVRAKDEKAILTLYNWEGVSDKMRSITTEETEKMFLWNILRIRLSALPKDFELEYVREGVRFRPNVMVMGVIEILSSSDGTSLTTKIPYGKKGQVFFLANAVGEQVYVPATTEKALSISVMGTFWPKKVLFSGYCLYVKGEKEFRYEIKGEGNLWSSFWGDSIKYCSVQKTSMNGKIQLWIAVDGKDTFKSQWEETARPVVYESKSKQN